jgi:hypothetical protein
MDKKTQQEKVLNYLRKNKNGITSMKAFWLFRITRLSARIYELRNKGMHIITIKERNRFTNGFHGRYVLVSEIEWWAV